MFCVCFFVLIPSSSHAHPTPDVFAPKNTKKRQKKCQKGETPFSIDPKHIFGSKLCPETPFFVYFLDFYLIFWKFGQNRLCCPKGQNSLFFTIFFNFFCILWYLEGEFGPTVPRHPGRSPRGEKYFFSLKKIFPEKMTFYFAPGLRPTGAKPCINK